MECYAADSFFVVETASSVPQELPEWAARHAGLTRLPYKGRGQRVGVLDTGCDIHHPDLRGRVEAASFITGNRERPAWRDDAGHGTFCTGEIVARQDSKGVVGVAYEATAFHGRVLYGNHKDHRRNAWGHDFSSAIRACVAEGCGVISMSLGGPGKTPGVEAAIDEAVDKGVLVVAAAGNERVEGSPYVSYPAGYKNVISVAAANKADMPAWFSTIGRGGAGKPWQQPEIAIASLEYYWGCIPGQYGKMIGTSMSTPLFAGAALLWREAREKAAEEGKRPMPTGSDVLREFRAWLKSVANDTNKNGWDPELGYGVLLLEDGEL